MTKTIGFSRRLGGEGPAFGVIRFSDKDDHPLWRMRISQHCTAEPYWYDGDLTKRVMLDMRIFVDDALKALDTDGGTLDSIAPVEIDDA